MNGVDIIQNPPILVLNSNNNFIDFFSLSIFFLNNSELNIDDVGNGNFIHLDFIFVLLTLWPLQILCYTVFYF